MSILTPSEYGGFLGFSLGIDGPASTTFPRSAEEIKNETVVRTLQYVGLHASGEEESSYGEQFASLFFPSYVRTFVGMEEVGSSALLCLGMFQMLCTTSSNVRFIREHPEEALKLYVALASALCFMSRSAAGPVGLLTISVDDATKTCNFIALLSLFVLELATQLPTSYLLLPPLPAAVRLELRRLLVLVQDDPRFILPSSDLRLLVLKEAVDSRDLGLFREVVGENGVKRAWFDCELARDQEDLVCRESTDGMEMMACSRCLAVRYCSKEHQKADWKRHKLVCFKPSW